MLENLAPAFLIAMAAGGLAYALLFPLLSGQKQLEERQKVIAGDIINGRSAKLKAAPQRSRRESVAQSLKEMEAREKARGNLTLEDKFRQAGFTIDRKTFYIYSAFTGLAGAMAANLLIGSLLVMPVAAIVTGVGLPNWYLSYKRKKRVTAFLNEFPNALDVIVRGLRSGLPLNDCVRIISNEAAEPVRTEFRLMMEAQAIGLSLADAIEDLYSRVPTPEANYFAIIVMIQQKTGGNLAESLSNMSKVVRDRRKLKGKIQALALKRRPPPASSPPCLSRSPASSTSPRPTTSSSCGPPRLASSRSSAARSGC